ncbi:hypothetical protein D092_17215 [Rhodococcus ruber Chol-4]|uniref:hypothetical protein n=2 Tax=Nocardiaceae TaxID=85025 RepID=UPI00034814F9|nr:MULTISPECIES: hypothetical protein [Rhodococcus]ATQ30597.1 hypothetical protein CS378_18900 [Rhodococcus ruber]AUM19672.1 hypothetical protein CSW53_25990 [Rhodococcus ruber]KXF84869.1 hypothetical protein D092_17215 [Rhodococcus ruber Chol-4]MBD8056292.1 hypothetical protein [Rhodococcus ruber]MCF8786684.1 hypothetical protein [Rhodococcus ruber]
MSQLSFFGAEVMPPDPADLGGLLAAHGHAVVSGDGARISVVVDEPWRADAIAELMTQAALSPEVTRTDEGHPLVRTAALPELVPVAAEWTRGAVKAVPAGWVPGSRALRAWVLAAGRVEVEGERYVLGLDPHTPDTHAVLAQSLMRAGIAPTLIGARGAGPGLRVSGRRRLTRLVENIGAPPDDARARQIWPRVQ